MATGTDKPGKPSGKDVATKERLSAYFTIAAAAFGLISDGYQNNLMTMSNVVFKKLYPNDYTAVVSTRVSNALLVGAVLGQVCVGLICDRIGRKVALVATTLLIVVGATLATAAHASTPAGLFWFLTVARGITGVGVGGEYPASSTSASEAANEKMLKRRGPVFIMVTNFVLSFGGPLAVSIFLIVLSAAGERHLQTVWRSEAVSERSNQETCSLLAVSEKILESFNRDMRGMVLVRFRGYFLFGHQYTQVSKLNKVTFPNGVFSGTIISSVVVNGNLKATAEWQLLLGAIALPGVLVGAYLCNILGRRNTMMLGFSGYLLFGLIIGLAYDRIIKIIPLFVVFYGLMQSCGNMGPGDMLGLVSAESFPTSMRGTGYGLAAAIGKTGAAVGTQVFTPIQNNLGKKWTFIIAAICGVTGVIVTYLFVPDMTGVDLADEDVKWMQYLAENGWEGQIGEDDDKELVFNAVNSSDEEKASLQG
ncbi:hypothetical protein D9758_000176 [Tetrapyrgos nigripes]|uniref:Major facilitator superfamily (MFS) profile domain-containing protein n=1 Tax=Tetrapyrgos nigripes TaxID=182062 RepID=A0A8H5H193_9AGAR|nr:hypothetical protein D9758_000176 [Tetrapyrgos nigripes]